MFKRREPEDALEGEGFLERHILIHGNIENFDSSVLLWRDNEGIIFEEELNKQSKLIVTHSDLINFDL